MFLYIVVNNIILANVVSLVEAVTSIWKHATINRRKQLILLIVQCLLCGVSYLLLGAYVALWSNGYAIIKYFYILTTHKEEKVKLKTIENILLNIPYLIFAIIFFKHDGWLGLMYAIVGCIDDSRFWLKSDLTKQKVSVVIEVFYAVYEFAILDIVKGIKQLINMIINIINVIRVKKNGEDAYYSQKGEK